MLCAVLVPRSPKLYFQYMVTAQYARTHFDSFKSHSNYNLPLINIFPNL